MKKAWIVYDPGLGDGGKGAATDDIAERYHIMLNVRFNGGAQAAHNVTADGKHHTFRMFGSATFVGAKTHLGPGVLVDPVVIELEAKELEALGVHNPMAGISCDEQCLITTPFQIEASLKWAQRHKSRSCAMGIWETLDYAKTYPSAAIRAVDLWDYPLLLDKLGLMASIYGSDLGVVSIAQKLGAIGLRLNLLSTDAWNYLRDSTSRIIFEGAQGVCLDRTLAGESFGTSTNTTLTPALLMLGKDEREIEKVAVMRIYQTRHGAGPFPTETRELDCLAEHDNKDTDYAGRFRRGWLDLFEIQRGITAVGADSIHLSHMDYWWSHGVELWRMAHLKRDDENEPLYTAFSSPNMFMAYIEDHLHLPIKRIGFGPGRKDRKTR